MTNQFENSEAVIVTHYQGLTMNQRRFKSQNETAWDKI